MATKKKAAKKATAKKPTYKALLDFIKKYETWLKEYHEVQTRDGGGGDTPPPPKWP